MGDEGTHLEVIGQGQRFLVAPLDLLNIRRRAPRDRLAQQPQRLGLNASLLVIESRIRNAA